MKEKLKRRLANLRQDFTKVTKESFDHFYCPVLLCDQQVELCEAHIVNQAFPNSSRAWTIQRKDVDGFYGSVFESEYVKLQYKVPSIAGRAMLDKELYRKLQPRIYLDGNVVEHYFSTDDSKGKTPRLTVGEDEAVFNLKLTKEQLAVIHDQARWEVGVSQDLRLPALVSLLKAAHLTMFSLLGYSYALSTGGKWLANIMGSFFVNNSGRAKKLVLSNARIHFMPFVAMVRPALSPPTLLKGTVDDGYLHFCWNNEENGSNPWAMIVYIRCGDFFSAVILPTFESVSGAKRFGRLLQQGHDSFDVSMAQLTNSGWRYVTHREEMVVPPSNFDNDLE